VCCCGAPSIMDENFDEWYMVHAPIDISHPIVKSKSKSKLFMISGSIASKFHPGEFIFCSILTSLA
jgi:hypothetical protein